ncbi:oxygen-independent coproporphyrinogen-3 oxidase [Aliiruegeria haliotis]|uniref:Heme chaperone HemW n=1 Tax=Aliiruegeria haliotis TaxID=1280846 RepID=A0A2T0RHT2_9RHOB|nr:radical SAM family heme chaperone HemW [Aliiruegeria haliotis]PRY20681.1 oxygen-independent coproporphyrinogen-3 oxidase [Aliiruegeria haliotis]
MPTPSPNWLPGPLPVADWQNAGFGLYLHWPFCQSKCPYCDFNSHVWAEIDQRRWRNAYVAEIEKAGTLTTGRKLDTVYFGGGTPSLMDPDSVADILDAILRTWPVSNDWEVTLEANPSSVEAGRFSGYRQAGINRVSLGVQSLRDDDLRRLGRLHSAKEARTAYDIARSTFERVSFDLIYARQDQSMEEWSSELSMALDLAIDHLSLYQLTIEPGTAFGDRFARGRLPGLPDEDLSADMYDYTVQTCAERGLHRYEVSNFARPGSESEHNMLYWSGGDYLGIGPGAHGRLTTDHGRHATVCPSSPASWLASVEAGESSYSTFDPLTGQETAEEYLMMGLRLVDGISMSRLTGMWADDGMNDRIAAMISAGFLDLAADRLWATDRGLAILNAVLREVLAG